MTEFARFWRPGTFANTIDAGEDASWRVSSEGCTTPWVTADGTFLLVKTSTFFELSNLYNASIGGTDHTGAQYLPEWPWRLLIDMPAGTQAAIDHPFTFPVGS